VELKMNYSELSDDKINLQVFERLFGNIGEDRDMLRVWQQGKFQPCNSWADAGPIIEKENISLIFGFGHWDAMSPDGESLQAEEVNPLRAAMIVFLMMQESPNA
jgi:hypothetical protein